MTNFIKEKEIELLKEIREYTFDNKELLNAHHFLFACPVKKNGKPADVIVCGINPGGDPKEADYRKVYQGNPSDPTDIVRGYDFPKDINKLQPYNGRISIITKPNVSAFGQGGRGLFEVTVDFVNKKLSYKGNDNKIYTENYDSVIPKIVLPDKKYIKQ